MALNLLGMPANMDQRAFSPNQLPRYGLTQSEVDGLTTVLEGWDGTVAVDPSYAQVIYWLDVEDQSRLRTLKAELLAGTVAAPGYDLVLIRDEVVDGVLAWGEGAMYRLNYDPREELVAAGYKVVFRNEDVTGLAKWLDNHESGR